MSITATINVTEVNIKAVYNDTVIELKPVVIKQSYQSTQPKVIDGYIVNTTGNEDGNSIEVGNIINGEITPGRYIVAKVNELPHTNENNLTIYIDSQTL